MHPGGGQLRSAAVGGDLRTHTRRAAFGGGGKEGRDLGGTVVIRSVIRLQVVPGQERAFEDQFRQRGVLKRAREVARMRTGELLRPLAGGSYVVVATRDSAEDYAVWINSPVRAEV